MQSPLPPTLVTPRCGARRRVAWPTRTVLSVALALAAGACASGRDGHRADGVGERAAYQVWNDDLDVAIESPELLDPATGALLYANLLAPAARGLASTGRSDLSAARRSPRDDDLALPRPRAGAYALAVKGHRIPEYVLVRWRMPPLPGVRRYGGEVAGPFRLAVRSRIPAEVLESVRDQWRLRLEIAVSANRNGPGLQWQLVRQHDDGPVVERRGEEHGVAAAITGQGGGNPASR